MTEGSLLVLFVFMRSFEPDASNSVLSLFGKLSRRRGALAWFHGVWTCTIKVLEY
jgi:hypothetical protein